MTQRVKPTLIDTEHVCVEDNKNRDTILKSEDRKYNKLISCLVEHDTTFDERNDILNNSYNSKIVSYRASKQINSNSIFQSFKI